MLGGGWVHEETQGLVPGLYTLWTEGKGRSTNGTNQQQSIWVLSLLTEDGLKPGMIRSFIHLFIG